MQGLEAAFGVAVLAVVAWDVFAAVLHPSARGLFSPLVARTVWRVLRALAPVCGGRRLLTFAGPVAILGNLLAWTTGMWVGFALVYVPFIESFRFAEDVSFGSKGFLDALYMSGVSLSTVGFGDVVAETYPLRFATAMQAASGLALFTAAISFVLSVYSALTTMRTDARRFCDRGLLDVDTALRIVSRDAESLLLDMHGSLVGDEQQRQRFPVHFYFPDMDMEESRSALFRSVIVVCLAARAVVQAPNDRLAAAALETALLRTMSDYERGVLGTPGECADIDDTEAQARLDALRRQASSSPADASATADSLAPFTFLLRRGEAFLRKLDHAYCYRHEPLLGSFDDASR